MDQAGRPRFSVRAVVDTVTTVMMLVAACVLVWATVRASTATRRTPPTALPLPKEPVSIAHSPAMGDASAQVVVIEFSDFECPACQQFAVQILPSFRKKWVDSARVQLVFKHAPINPSHQNAARAAASAGCAATQERFWPMHDRLFGANGRLTDEDLRLHAGGLGLDLSLFDLCVEGADGKEAIAADLRLAGSLGVRVTPTFFVGRRVEAGMVWVTSILEGVPPDSIFGDGIPGRGANAADGKHPAMTPGTIAKKETDHGEKDENHPKRCVLGPVSRRHRGNGPEGVRRLLQQLLLWV